MIFVDYSQTAISTMMAVTKGDGSIVNESFIRHMILNCLRSYRNKFKSTYGELCICCDGKGSWRKQEYPFYKANRQKDRDKSVFDWDEIFRCLNLIREEIKENFGYPVLCVDGLEADDIISYVAQNWSHKNIIISNDTDFFQLHCDTIEQYLPLKHKIHRETNTRKCLKEHIIQGDRGDGVPNVLSDDDTFIVEGKRQKSMTAKKLEELLTLDISGSTDNQLKKNYYRNNRLVNLQDCLFPEQYQSMISEEFLKQNNKNNSKVYSYFIGYGLKNLMKDITDFTQ